MKSQNLFAIGLFLIAAISCKEENTPGNPVVDDELVAERYIQTFEKISQMSAVAEQLWPGYDYVKTQPAYLILKDKDGLKNRGYILNPPATIPPNSTKLPDEQSGGLNIYRNDQLLASALAVLGQNAFILSDFKVNGQSYFLLIDKENSSSALPFYEAYRKVDGNWLPLLFVHEFFHAYQYAEWTFPPDTQQDLVNYPVTEEVATVELALFDLMKTVSVATPLTSEQRKDYLARFVVLLEELFEVDPTGGILEGSVPVELFLEGSARYMEHYSAVQTIYPAIDSDVTHGWAGHLPNMSTTMTKHFLSKRVWYHVGAGALFLLEKEGLAVHTEVMSGETAYSIARDYLMLSDEEKTALLEEIKSQETWGSFQTRAKAMMPA